MLTLNPDGTQKLPEVFAMPGELLTPVWDKELTVLGRVYQNVEGWSTPKLTEFVNGAMAAGEGKGARVVPQECVISAGKTPPPTPMRVWEGACGETYTSLLSALALAPNAVVAAHQKSKGGWMLSGLDRSTGAALWSVDLPAEPVFNGICIGRDGQMIVVLRDGGAVCFGE